MRTKLVLAGLLAGLATTVAPLSASAYCEPEIIDTGEPGGCRNSCMETGARYEKARMVVENKVHAVKLPSYWDVFSCPM